MAEGLEVDVAEEEAVAIASPDSAAAPVTGPALLIIAATQTLPGETNATNARLQNQKEPVAVVVAVAAAAAVAAVALAAAEVVLVIEAAADLVAAVVVVALAIAVAAEALETAAAAEALETAAAAASAAEPCAEAEETTDIDRTEMLEDECFGIPSHEDPSPRPHYRTMFHVTPTPLPAPESKSRHSCTHITGRCRSGDSSTLQTFLYILCIGMIVPPS